jgi:hypothetical protein
MSHPSQRSDAHATSGQRFDPRHIRQYRGNPTRVVGRPAHSPFPHRADQID